ncbi:MAG: hypothetical protein ACOX60_06240 [Massiliimalia sp.]|jgi:hypothetical protein
MDAVEFLKELERMVKTDPVATKKYYSNCSKHQEAVNFVEQWSKSHPQKTRLQDFLEKHPKALKDDVGRPVACARLIGYCEYCDNEYVTAEYCLKCWNKPLEE